MSLFVLSYTFTCSCLSLLRLCINAQFSACVLLFGRFISSLVSRIPCCLLSTSLDIRLAFSARTSSLSNSSQLAFITARSSHPARPCHVARPVHKWPVRPGVHVHVTSVQSLSKLRGHGALDLETAGSESSGGWTAICAAGMVVLCSHIRLL